jgi:hypothetical protein
MSEEDIPSLEKINEAKEKVEKLLRHINNVQEACYLLGKKLIERAKSQVDIEFGIRVIAIGQIHDHSKFFGIEFDYLVGNGNFNGEAKLAAQHHVRSNHHHFECWGSPDLIPKIYIAEFVCDIFSRAAEFGTDVREYIKEKALPRYKISPQSKVYKWIKEFLDLLLDKPFVDSPVDVEIL